MPRAQEADGLWEQARWSPDSNPNADGASAWQAKLRLEQVMVGVMHESSALRSIFRHPNRVRARVRVKLRLFDPFSGT